MSDVAFAVWRVDADDSVYGAFQAKESLYRVFEDEDDAEAFAADADRRERGVDSSVFWEVREVPFAPRGSSTSANPEFVSVWSQALAEGFEDE